jgi:hypothetical protein
MYPGLNGLMSSDDAAADCSEDSSSKDGMRFRGAAAPAAEASAPPADASAAKPAVAAARNLDTLQQHLGGKRCAVCHRSIMNDADDYSQEHAHSSLVLFSHCSHVVHLGCVAAQLRQMSLNQFAERAWQHSCAACALGNTDDAEAAEADNARILRSFKVHFAKQHRGQSYDKLKQTPASLELKRYILSAKPEAPSAVSALASLVPASLSASIAGVASRLRAKRRGVAAADDDDAAAAPLQMPKNEALDEEIRENHFIDLMLKYKRTLDDVLALEEGSLLQLYRCGVQSYDDLRALDFDPLRHLRGESTLKTPAWQMHDLYGFRFEHLVEAEEEGGYGMPVEDVAKFIDMRPREWSLIGASAAKFIGLQMNIKTAAHFRMTLEHWQKYLHLQPAHLQGLGVYTRRDFVETMRWDAHSPLCPRR